jgi:hypothetical protein
VLSNQKEKTSKTQPILRIFCSYDEIPSVKKSPAIIIYRGFSKGFHKNYKTTVPYTILMKYLFNQSFNEPEQKK